MTIQTTTLAVAVAPVITLKGKGKAIREVAYMQIAALSFIENASRTDTIDNMRKALGTSPSEPELATAQAEWTIGRVAARLPESEVPAESRTDEGRLEFARKIVLNYAAPAQPGKAARNLRAGQLGRRSMIQHKACMAAKEAWSLVKAELGLGGAQTLAEKKSKEKAKRSTNSNAVRGDGKGTATPAHSELVKPATAMSADEACAYVMTQATTLLAFANKNGKVLPTDFGAAIQAFKSACNKAANAHEVRKAAKESAAK